MEKLIIKKNLKRLNASEIECIWTIENEECKDICNHTNTFNTLSEIEEYDLNAKLCILQGVNNYYEASIYELDENPIKEEAEKYKKRQIDGANAINTLMSELRLNAISNNYPRIINKTIEESFKKVTDNILLGWWISAKEECELVPVGGYITQELKDRILNTINIYIQNNYN